MYLLTLTNFDQRKETEGALYVTVVAAKSGMRSFENESVPFFTVPIISVFPNSLDSDIACLGDFLQLPLLFHSVAKY